MRTELINQRKRAVGKLHAIRIPQMALRMHRAKRAAHCVDAIQEIQKAGFDGGYPLVISYQNWRDAAKVTSKSADN